MAEETKHGYMRVRNPESEKAGVGIFDKFLPVTRADLVITDEQSAESLADKLIAIDDHMATNDFSVMPEQTVTLQPGNQAIESPRMSNFHLKEIKGKTLINLIGSIGACDSTAGWSITGSVSGTLTVETDIKDRDNSLKATRTGTAGSMYVRSSNITIDPSKHLVVLGWISNPIPDPSMVGVRLVANGAAVSGSKSSFCAGGETRVVFRAFTPSELGSVTSVQIDTYSTTVFNVNDHYFMDSIRAYHITAEEYANIDTLTTYELNERYPFTPTGINGVENPYVIATSDNLIPPFYEWNKGAAKLVVNEPYSAIYTRSGPGQNIFVDIPTIENTSYSFSVEADTDHSGEIQFYDGSGTIIGSHVPFTDRTTFTTPAGSVRVRVVLLTLGGSNGTVTFSNPILTTSPEVKSFKPQRKSMLAFQTELFSNLDGDSDMLFKTNGQYYKLTKWRKLIVDGSLSYMYVPTNLSGFKVVYIANGAVDAESQFDSDDDGKLFATKHNGMPLTVDDSGVYTWPSADLVRIFTSNIYFSISNADSGWGDNYEPSQEDIKAYFMGWRMASPDNWGLPYPGTGTKAWGKIDKNGDLIAGSGTDIFPTTVNTESTPYNIIYRLAKESIEPVINEGHLTMSDDNNMVKVGSGIVLREEVDPRQDVTSRRWYFNSSAGGSWDVTKLKNKASAILRVYKNNKPDPDWIVETHATSNGLQRAYIEHFNYDQSAVYSATYIVLDKSHAVNMVGELSSNERSQIDNLISETGSSLEQWSILKQEIIKMRTDNNPALQQEVDKLKTDTETALEQTSELQQEVSDLRSEVEAAFQSGVSAKNKVVISTNANFNQGVTENSTWDTIANVIGKMYGPGSSIPLNKIIPMRKFTQSWTKTTVANARHLHARNGAIAMAHQNSVGTKSVIRYNRNSVEMWAKTDIGMAVDAHIDASGDVFVAYSNLSGTTLRKIGSTSAMEMWADSAIINARAIITDPYGYIYSAHSNTPGNRTVRKFDSSGNQIWYDTVGYGTALAIGTMSGSLFVAYANPGTSAGAIRRYTMNGDEVWVDNTTYPPTRIALDQDENLYVTYQTSSNITIRKINYNGTEQWASSHIRNPVGIAVDEEGFVYVTANNTVGATVYILDKNGTLIGEDSIWANGYGVSPDGEGNIIVSHNGFDFKDGQIRKLYHNVAHYKLV